MLIINDCGKSLAMSHQNSIRMNIPLVLIAKGGQEFPVTIYRETNEECVLKFSLLDAEKNVLTTKEVGILPGCPYVTTPIDVGLDYTLPEIVQEHNSTVTPKYVRDKLQSSHMTNSSLNQSTFSTGQTKKTLLTYTNEELQSAVSLLVEKGLLSSEDIDKLQEPLTRIDVAKLFVQIALANNLQQESSKSCEFSDMRDRSEEDMNIARLVCQFNIMGIHPDHTALENFMPNAIISSEQIVTAFSRLMWRDTYETPEDEERYYELHFNTMYNLKLVDNKINNIDQKLVDFVIIVSRALQVEQLVINSIEEKREKSIFWFW